MTNLFKYTKRLSASLSLLLLLLLLLLCRRKYTLPWVAIRRGRGLSLRIDFWFRMKNSDLKLPLHLWEWLIERIINRSIINPAVNPCASIYFFTLTDYIIYMYTHATLNFWRNWTGSHSASIFQSVCDLYLGAFASIGSLSNPQSAYIYLITTKFKCSI